MRIFLFLREFIAPFLPLRLFISQVLFFPEVVPLRGWLSINVSLSRDTPELYRNFGLSIPFLSQGGWQCSSCDRRRARAPPLFFIFTTLLPRDSTNCPLLFVEMLLVKRSLTPLREENN